MQICSGGLIRGHVVVFIPNTVGREELLERPTTESTRMGVHLDLHGILHTPVETDARWVRCIAMAPPAWRRRPTPLLHAHDLICCVLCHNPNGLASGFHSPGASGAGPTISNNHNSIRFSTALGYLGPCRHRLNLTK